MKRKILATALCAITAATCAFGLTACNNDGGTPKTTALENAYKNYSATQNLTVTVTDSRTVKYGNDYSTLVKIDYEHKAAYATNLTSYIDDVTNLTISSEHYYEVDSNKPGFNIYSSYMIIEEDATPSDWNIIDRSDLFNDEFLSYYDTQTEYEIKLLTNWVDSYIPSHAFLDTSWRATENGEDNG